jgi:signal transduction histidine kinase/DNA-binding response OmpR family regulator/HAMP domain-containing protein
MKLSLRSKLFLIVGATAASLAIVIAIGVELAGLQREGLDSLERRVLPKLELEPRLAAQFERLGQHLRDAVAAQDKSALVASNVLVNEMFQLLERAGSALEPVAAAELRAAITVYHERARDVSGRLIDGETGEALVEAMEAMQAQQKHVQTAIQHVAGLDKHVLEHSFQSLRASSKTAGQAGLAIALGSLALVIGLSIWLGRGALASLAGIGRGMDRFARGEFGEPIEIPSADEIGQLALEANRMAAALDELIRRRDAADWVRAGQVALAEALRGDFEVREAARAAIQFVARRVDAVAGVLYLVEADGSSKPAATHALGAVDAAERLRTFAPGEGLVGEVARARELRVVTPVPPNYLVVRTGLGGAPPQSLVISALEWNEQAIGVIELALFKPCSEEIRDFLAAVSESLAAVLDSSRARARLRDLLEESQTLANRLAAQEEELVQNNRELSVQQEELRQANDELEAQRSALKLRNAELEQARNSLQDKANELSNVSAYKSQFLANMSHELRTPLNSMLLLSSLLAENEAGNLTARQVEHCRTVYSAGKGLLALINQVLDLSKIEAGKQELDTKDVMLRDIADQVRRTFEPQFNAKGVAFKVEIAADVPPMIVTDGDCLTRILINLLGNALKFTEKGSVTFGIEMPDGRTRLERPGLSHASSVAFRVTDTGVGIPASDRDRIFARFEQADARTARRYGGTGLGLAIARESAALLGGELQLESVEGQGSTFTCIIPEHAPPPARIAPSRNPEVVAPRASLSSIPDDRHDLARDEPYLLIVEDDAGFAGHLLEVVHDLGLKAVHVPSGEEALRTARARAPAGVVLDVKLPDLDGPAVRQQLLRHAETASVPVHFISAMDAPGGTLGPGVVGYLTKPATRESLVDAILALSRPLRATTTRVLIVEDDADQSESLAEMLAESQLETRQAHTAEAAMQALASEQFACVVLDLGLPDADGLRLLERVQARPDISLPPVVVHTARALSRDEARYIRRYAEAVVLKGGRSAERIVDEVRLFANQVRDKLPRPSRPSSRPPVGTALSRDVTLDGAKILIADDDMRTVYALSALLRGKGAEVVIAETGREALRLLDAASDVQLVLMDIMMPDMDGYEAMRQLRAQQRFAKLPVIALTAKAMRGERERCHEAGASDYMTKPVDPGSLLQTLSRWLSEETAAT